MANLIARGQITISDINDGYSCYLSQESIVLPCEADGSGAVLTNASTDVLLLYAEAQVTPILGTLVVSNCTATKSGNKVTINTVSSAYDNGYVDIPVSYNGISFGLKRFSYAKVKRGQSVTVVLTSEAHSIACDKDGVPNTGEIGASGKAKTTVQVFRDGQALTGVTTPGINQFSYTIGTVANCTAGRVDNSTLYLNTVTADSGSVQITVNVENALSLTKIFTFTKTKAGSIGSNGKTYVLNVLGGVRAISYNAIGQSPSPATSSTFSVMLYENGTLVTPATYAWASEGNLSGTKTTATFVPIIGSTFNTGNTSVTATITYAGNTITNTVPIASVKDATGLDWVNDWTTGATVVNGQKVITPRIFAGTNSGTASVPNLTGLALGKDVMNGTEGKIGAVLYKNNNAVFQLKDDGGLVIGASGKDQITLDANGSAVIPDITGSKIKVGTLNADRIVANSITINQLASSVGSALDISSNTSITLRVTKDALISAINLSPEEITIAANRISLLGTTNISDAAITNAKIEDAAITNAKIDRATVDKLVVVSADIANAAILTAHISDLSVTTGKIADAAINTAKIENASITNAKIDRGTANKLVITTADISDAAIKSAQIDDAQITTAKIANGAITTALIENAAIGTTQIADGSITDAKIVDLTANKITAGVLSTERLIIRDSVNPELSLIYEINNITGALQVVQGDTVNGEVLTERSITKDKIVAKSITAEEIAAKSITANEMVVNTITAASGVIADAAITTAKIGDLQVTTAKIGLLAVDTAQIKDAAISTAKIGNLQVTGAKIANATIDTAQIKDAAITTAKIDDLQVTSAKIALLAVDTAQINDAAITTAKIGLLQVTDANIENLNASKLNTGFISAARIEAGSLGASVINTTTINSTFSNAVASTINSAFITDALVSSLSANKINAGSIKTNSVSIISGETAETSKLALVNEAVIISDGTQQRVVLGKYTIGDNANYGLVVRGSDGTTVLFDNDGVTRAGVVDGAINNAKVGVDANISGSKLDINSVITSVNGATTQIKASKIQLDAEAQTLEIAFNSLASTVTTQGTTLTTQGTSISTIQGQITSKVWQTDITTAVSNKEDIITKATTAPIAPTPNQLWLDTSVIPNALKRYNGVEWEAATPMLPEDIGAYPSEEGIELDERISNTYSELTQTKDLISTKVGITEFDLLQGKFESSETVWNLAAGKADLIVSGTSSEDFGINGIALVSAINLTPSDIVIDSSHINLKGSVTIEALSSDLSSSFIEINGITKIDGGNIATGSITADLINLKGLAVTKTVGETEVTTLTIDENGSIQMQGTVQSEDFVSSVSGWKISESGDSEFNNTIVRGSVILPNAGFTNVDYDEYNSIRFYAGSTYEDRNSAPFRVLQDGSLFATKGTFGGTFTGKIVLGDIIIDDTTPAESGNASIKFMNGEETAINISAEGSHFTSPFFIGTPSDRRFGIEGVATFIHKNSFRISPTSDDTGTKDIVFANSVTDKLIKLYDNKFNIDISDDELVFSSNTQPSSGYNYKFEWEDKTTPVKMLIDGSVDITDSIGVGNLKITRKTTAGNSGVVFSFT